MKQVVLSLNDESEKRLRRLALQVNEGKKGALSKTVEEALFELEKQRLQRKSLARLMELANQDLMLGVGKFDREEAYRR
ncbi:MAG: hypothetical protein HY917_01150 [Candidatus Diapherotrites archaeon]|nr:hypothetical protein [Candidatus Diapherotrites archaeon]